LFIYLARGVRLVRFIRVLEFLTAVRSGERRLHLEDVEFLKGLLLTLVSAKAGPADGSRVALIHQLEDVQEMVGQLKALLVGEASDLLGRHVSGTEVEPPNVLEPIRDQLEVAVVRVTLCLDLVPGYAAAVERLAARGPRAREAMVQYLDEVSRLTDDQQQELQVIVVQARRALDAWQEAAVEPDVEPGHPDREILGQIVARVDGILASLPPRLYEATSGDRTAVRRLLNEARGLRQRHPTDPAQLPLLAMLLVRLDRSERYAEYLEEVRWMKHFAVGRPVTRPTPGESGYTPGLLRVIEQVGLADEPIGTNAAALVRELTGEQDLSVYKLT
jgi:hypothetical protein